MSDAMTEQSEKERLGELVRGVHRKFPSGVTAVTVTSPDGTPRGLAVNAFSSVSLDPPLLMVTVNATSSTYPWLFAADHLAVNIIASAQTKVIRRFAQSGGDKFAEIAWHPGITGSPVIDGVAGHFEIAVRYKIPAYTHTIFIGEVVAAEYSDDPALIYLGGAFYEGDKLTPTDF
ncbi:hypothetical protein GCM10022381_25820 [Leifsonia kafniensis]|uniref:Flavin reductase like domain-containing protein n=1 Tax=Leifsonia kafniensis TaxID=475957 RepID=A0ABP7KM40_9MICO